MIVSASEVPFRGNLAERHGVPAQLRIVESDQQSSFRSDASQRFSHSSVGSVISATPGRAVQGPAGASPGRITAFLYQGAWRHQGRRAGV